MRFDDFDFDCTSKAVYRMNPTIRDQYSSPDQLRQFMESMAYRYCATSNSFSTAGFCLTAYNGLDGERVVRASVSSYVAMKYIAQVDKSIEYCIGKLVNAA